MGIRGWWGERTGGLGGGVLIRCEIHCVKEQSAVLKSEIKLVDGMRKISRDAGKVEVLAVRWEE